MGDRAVRVTSHTQTDRAEVPGSNSMDVGSYMIAVVLGAPFALAWLFGAIELLQVPEMWFVALAALPFVLWRYRVCRRNRLARRSRMAGRNAA